MGIDPFTVAAQVVNFLVLVVLLKRFLYQPVLRAMSAREARVRQRLDEAAAARSAAEAEDARLKAANDELQAKREGLLREAREAADERRSELLAAARAEADRRRERWREAIEREKETLLEELERRMLERVDAIARRALRDLADEELEHAIARAFVRRLAALEPADWTRTREHPEDEAPESFVVTSAFPLPQDTREAIDARIRAAAGEDAVVRYEVRPETIAGVELRAHGLRVAWSLGDFVDSLADLLPARGLLSPGEQAAEQVAVESPGEAASEPEGEPAREAKGGAPGPAGEPAGEASR